MAGPSAGQSGGRRSGAAAAEQSATRGTVKFYFYSGTAISPYSAAREKKQEPKEILIRLVHLNHGSIAKYLVP